MYLTDTSYQRYLQASLSPPWYSEFQNSCYSNRCEWISRGGTPLCPFPRVSKSGCDPFHFLKRSEQFHKKCQSGKPFLKENEFHQRRWIQEKGGSDVFCPWGRRHLAKWGAGPPFQRFKSSFEDSHFQRRNPNRSRNDPQKFQWCQDERLESVENARGRTKNTSVENLRDSKPDSPAHAECETSSSNNVSTRLSEKLASPETNNGYASWYHAEEQQQIVNMLKEVNTRHERQLRRAHRPNSDDSTCSNADRTTLSSDDEDDGIVVLVSPEEDDPPPDEENDLPSDYLEKSVSDYFEEFQSIFTVSPEKNIINTLTKECLKECAEKAKETEDASSSDGKESFDRKKGTKNAEIAKGDDSPTAMAETESDIGDLEKGITSEPDQREAELLTAVAEGDQSANSDEPRILLDDASKDSEDNENRKSVVEASNSACESKGKIRESLKCKEGKSQNYKGFAEALNSAYESKGKRSEGIKCEEGIASNAVQRSGKMGNICDRCSSRPQVTKFVGQLRKKDVILSLRTKPQLMKTSHTCLSYRQPETVYSFPNQNRVYMSCQSWPVDCHEKRDATDCKYKAKRMAQCTPDTMRKSGETAFLKKFPSFLSQPRISERREAKSEPYLSRRIENKIQNNMSITSFSDTHLPFKCQDMHYKRITVEELFQTVSRNRKDRDAQTLGAEEDFGLYPRKNQLITASDHLKRILKIGTQIQTSALKNNDKFNDKDLTVGDANMGKQFSGTSPLSGKYTPGDKCGQEKIFQTRDDSGKSTNVKDDHKSTRNNAHYLKQHYGVNYQTKYENTHENYKQEKFNQFSQKESSSSLAVCGPTNPINKGKSQNLDVVTQKNRNADSSSKKNPSKESVDRKDTTIKQKRRQKPKNDKAKGKIEDEIMERPACECKDNRYLKREHRTRDCSKYRSVPIKISTCIDDGKRDSWNDRKSVDPSHFSRKESSKYSESDCRSSNDVKTRSSQQPSESRTRDRRQGKAKDFTSRKNGSKSCASREINKESPTSAANLGLKNKNLRQTENNSLVVKPVEKGNSNVSDLNALNLNTNGDDRNFPAESRELKESDNNQSEENLHPGPDPINPSESSNQLRQNYVSKGLVSSRNVSDIDQAIKTRRNCDRLAKNHSDVYQKVSCSGKGNYFQASSYFIPRKSSSKSGNKASSSSGYLVSRTTDIQEQFVLENKHCYSKTFGIADEDCVISRRNTRKAKKQKYPADAVRKISDGSKQKNLTLKLESDARQEKTTKNMDEPQDNRSVYAAPEFPKFQNLANSAHANVFTPFNASVSPAASGKNRNFKSEEIGNEGCYNYAPSKEGEVSRGNQNFKSEEMGNESCGNYVPSKEGEVRRGNQIGCFNALDRNTQIYLKSAQKLNSDIDNIVRDSSAPSENIATKNCSDNLICRLTELAEEGSDNPLGDRCGGHEKILQTRDGFEKSTIAKDDQRVRKTTDESDSVADGIRALCLESEDSCNECLDVNSSENSLICQPSADSTMDFPVTKSLADSDVQKREDGIESNQPAGFFPKISASTLENPNEIDEMKSKCGEIFQPSGYSVEDFAVKKSVVDSDVQKRNQRIESNQPEDFVPKISVPTFEHLDQTDEMKSKCGEVFQLSGYSTEDFPVTKSFADSDVQNRNNGIESNQPTEDFVPKISLSTLKHPNQTDEMKSKCGEIFQPSGYSVVDFTFRKSVADSYVQKRNQRIEFDQPADFVRKISASTLEHLDQTDEMKSKCGEIFQPAGNSAEDFAVKKSVADSDKRTRNQRIESDQSAEYFVQKITASTLEHLDQTDEMKSKCGDQMCRNASKDNDLFTSQSSLKSLNCNRDTDSKATSNVLGLPRTPQKGYQVLKTIHVPVLGDLKIMLDPAAGVEDYQVSNSMTQKTKAFLHCNASLKGARADAQPQPDTAEADEFPEEKLRFLTLNEENGAYAHPQSDTAEADEFPEEKLQFLTLNEENGAVAYAHPQSDTAEADEFPEEKLQILTLNEENGAGADAYPQSDTAEADEFPEEKLQILALNEEFIPAPQVLPRQTVVSSFNSDTESIRKSKKERSEDDLNCDQLVSFPDAAQVSKVLR